MWLVSGVPHLCPSTMTHITTQPVCPRVAYQCCIRNGSDLPVNETQVLCPFLPPFSLSFHAVCGNIKQRYKYSIGSWFVLEETETVYSQSAVSIIAFIPNVKNNLKHTAVLQCSLIIPEAYYQEILSLMQLGLELYLLQICCIINCRWRCGVFH